MRRSPIGALALAAAILTSAVACGGSPAPVTPEFLPAAPNGCTYTAEYWPGVPGSVSRKVPMPERPGQADDGHPALDHLGPGEGFVAYAELDCSGVTYLAVTPAKWDGGTQLYLGLLRKTDAVTMAPPAPTRT